MAIAISPLLSVLVAALSKTPIQTFFAALAVTLVMSGLAIGLLILINRRLEGTQTH